MACAKNAKSTSVPFIPPECASWFEGKDFTQDWLNKKLGAWLAPLEPLIDRQCEILDVGSFEGRSAVAFLEYLPKSNVTTIDLFNSPDTERRCRRNLSTYGERATIVKGRAAAILDQFVWEQKCFDVIYLDAGKRPFNTLAQSCLAWSLLRIGGIVIWDDLIWKPQIPDSERPGPGQGIEMFAEIFADCFTELHRQQQLIVKKTSDWPRPAA